MVLRDRVGENRRQKTTTMLHLGYTATKNKAMLMTEKWKKLLIQQYKPTLYNVGLYCSSVVWLLQ